MTDAHLRDNDELLVGVDVQDSSVLILSRWPVTGLTGEVLAPPGTTVDADLPFFWHGTRLPLKLRAEVDKAGFEVRVCDPMGTPLLEWRCQVVDGDPE